MAFPTRLFAAAFSCAVLTAPAAHASSVTLDATSRLCVTDGGVAFCSDPFTPDGNYLTGRFSNTLYRGVFVYDLAAVSGAVTGASVAFQTQTIAGTFASSDETVSAYALSQTSIDNVLLGIAGTDLFDDAGTGTDLGFATLGQSDANQTVTFALGAAWLDALQDAAGGYFGFGLSIDGLDPTGVDRYVFGGSGNLDFKLTVEYTSAVIPLPAALPMLLGAFGSLGALAWRRRRFGKADQ